MDDPNTPRGISREKYFKELATDEKCERLREQVKRYQRRVEAMEAYIQLLEYHSHGVDGKILVPLTKDLPRNERSSRNEEYF